MRLNNFSSWLLAFVAVAMFASVGCDDNKVKDPPKNVDSHAGHDHDGADAHDDHPAHGEHGGHIFPIDSPDYQGEWKQYSDNDLIRMYVLDANGKPSPVKADSFVVTPKIGAGEVTFTLVGEEPNENGETAIYSLDDKDLTIAIPLGVTIDIKIGDKTLKGEIKAHEALDH